MNYFERGLNNRGNSRWVHGDSVLVFAKGDAYRNGRPGARAGFDVAHKPSGRGISAPLEDYDGMEPTNRRAELRAMVASMTMRRWSREGFDKLVIAIDSEYAVKGICYWIYKWQKNGWWTTQNTRVKHQDLWMELLRQISRLEREGVKVQFVQISEDLNELAARLVRRGVEMVCVHFIPTTAAEALLTSFL